ncbi:MAG: hypothetical protein ACXAD7_06960 [Candidatus Kariarchaeaceae archaeon]
MDSTEDLISKKSNMNSILRESLIQYAMIVVIGLISLFILKFLYRGFDFSKPLVMFLIMIIPYIVYSVTLRSNLYASLPQNEQKRAKIALFIVTVSLSLLLFEIGLYFVYCDGIFYEISSKYC